MAHTIGDFEQLILLALVRLGSDAYGVTIRREIEERTGRVISPGALYTALDRLEKRGFVSSHLGDPTPERGGKRKRLYTVRPAGERALARIYESVRQMASGLATRLQDRQRVDHASHEADSTATRGSTPAVERGSRGRGGHRRRSRGDDARRFGPPRPQAGAAPLVLATGDQHCRRASVRARRRDHFSTGGRDGHGRHATGFRAGASGPPKAACVHCRRVDDARAWHRRERRDLLARQRGGLQAVAVRRPRSPDDASTSSEPDRDAPGTYRPMVWSVPEVSGASRASADLRLDRRSSPAGSGT